MSEGRGDDARRRREARLEDVEGAASGERAVYVISVAAELAGVHPQTLRIYERKGLVRPKRTAGGSRRYSERDIERLRAIQALTQSEGVNLAGVRLIIEMQAELERMAQRLDALRDELSNRPIVVPGRRVGADIVPLRSVIPFPWEKDVGT